MVTIISTRYMPEKKFILKIVVGGDATVGKTCLLRRFVDEMFDNSTTMTVGVDFYIKELCIDESVCTLQIWDLGGQPRFRFMFDSYMRGTKGALLLFDLSNFDSFLNVGRWIHILRDHASDLPVLIVGSKMDLVDLITVSDVEVERMTKHCNAIGYLKTSAKSGINADLAFETLTSKILGDVRDDAPSLG